MSLPSLTTRRLRLSRSWWSWLLVAWTLACLAGTRSASGWLAGAAAVGCLLGVVALWLLVTIRREDLGDALDDAGGGGASGDGHGGGDGPAAEEQA